jgi:Ulp1 family protease
MLNEEYPKPELLTKNSPTKLEPKLTPQYEPDEVAILSTYFWSHESETPERRAKIILKHDLHTKNLILIPVCKHLHWTLLGIRNLKTVIEHNKAGKVSSEKKIIEAFTLDSLGRGDAKMENTCGKRVKEFVKEIFESQGQETPVHERRSKTGKEKNQLDCSNVVNRPRQPDGWSCGYFILRYIETILAHHPKNKPLENIDWTPTEDRHYKFKVIEICKKLKIYSDTNDLLVKHEKHELAQMKYMLEDSQDLFVVEKTICEEKPFSPNFSHDFREDDFLKDDVSEKANNKARDVWGKKI